MTAISDIHSYFDRLFEHLEWADQRALRSLRSMDPPSPEALRMYSHVLGSEETWLSRLEGRTPTLAVWPDMDLDSCERLAAQTSSALHRWVREASPERLEESIHYVTSTGRAYDTRIVDVLTHVCLHGAYHRGQVALLLRREGGEPIATDFVVFVRET